MKTKQLIFAAMALSIVGGFVFTTLPVLADTTAKVSVGANVHEDWQGKPGMRVGMMGKPAVVGTVSLVNGNTLTVSAHKGFATTSAVTTFTVDATNAKVTKANATSTVSSIAVGDTVVVVGTISGTNIAATSIRDGAIMRGSGKDGEEKSGQLSALQGNGEPVVAGSISAINGSTLTITNKSNVTYSVDTTNAKILVGQSISTLSNVKVGDAVVVQGTVNGTSIVASTIIDQAKPAGVKVSMQGFFGGIRSFFSHLFGF